MATRKNEQIVSACGGYFPADLLQALRADVRHDTVSIARAMGIPTQVLANAIAATDPVPLMPTNWTAVNAPGAAPYCRPVDVGVAAIPYAHPWYPGYTYGTPVYPNF